ncbi:TonB-dependent receptor domain-containing protein [Methyloversatilis sp.]|uniref:TonB-dependent receptor family protein n=1 Tax=Methyloversatilis sp. TaxID=2569862 RepID=UPI002732C827|nr:TonB-dependent receptor [Methyloversatilis sp.]MDP2870103.1 TonB-dependent receptor [Methyloversatilis sp.]MDP3454480.1 TonB-dependent receptor [Methyloversatilis sp.]MDP3701242.1 TonB-dependent receptor [Hylemonella sp.]
MHKPTLLAAAITGCFILPSAAFAQSTAPKTGEVDTVTVRGSILPYKLEHIPGSTSVLDTEQLEAQRPFSIKEALRTVPGVHVVDEDSFGLGLNIGIRGLNPRRTSRTLLLEDGMPLFLAPYGDPSAHYSTPIDRVERIEVVKGSGQVLYGPQTIGGMINFVTKPIPKKGVAGSVSATWGNNDYQGLHANVGVGGEMGGVMLDVIEKKGDGVRKNHDFDVFEVSMKGQLNINRDHTLIGKIGHYKEDSHITETGLGSVEYAEDKFQAPTGRNDRFLHERNSLQLQHIFQINDAAKLSTQAYYVDADRASFRQISDPGQNAGRSRLDQCDPTSLRNNLANADQCGGRWRPRDYRYWGIEPRLDFKHNTFGIASDAVIGFRYHEEDIKRNQFRDTDPRIQNLSFTRSLIGQNGTVGHREQIDITVEAKSYYVQNTFYVGDFSITPGVRYEDLKIKTDVRRAEGQPQDNPESFLNNNQSKVLPGFGIAWNGIQNTTVFAGVHKGFAPPRPDRDIVAPGGANTANVNKTRPEESTNWELGLRSSYFKGISLQSTLFYTDFDQIVIEDNGRFFNGGKSEQTGLEVAGRIDFGQLYNSTHNIYLTGSWTNLFSAKFKRDVAEENIVSGNRLPYAPKHLLSVAVGYQNPHGFDARLGADRVSEQFADGENTRVENLTGQEGTIPSYTVFNATMNFRPQGSKTSYFLSAYNLTDREYLVSRVDGKFAGRARQVIAGIRYAF